MVTGREGRKSAENVLGSVKDERVREGCVCRSGKMVRRRSSGTAGDSYQVLHESAERLRSGKKRTFVGDSRSRQAPDCEFCSSVNEVEGVCVDCNCIALQKHVWKSTL